MSRPSVGEGAYLKCRHCDHQPWKNTSNSSTRMREHLETHDIYKQTVVTEHLKRWDTIGTSRPPSQTPFMYSADEFTVQGAIDRFVRLVAECDIPTLTADHPAFRDFALFVGAGNLTSDDLPHRDKLKEHLYLRYGAEHAKLVEELQEALGRISYTTDMWTSGVLKGFMAITAHYAVLVGNTLIMRSRLIAFRYVPGSHGGDSMAPVFIQVLDECDVADRIGLITADNASPNDTMMYALEEILVSRGIPFHHEDNRARCFPHIINITVKTGVQHLGLPLDPDDPELPPEEQLDQVIGYFEANVDPVYEQALRNNPIGCLRDLVRACRGSGERRYELEQIIVGGNRAKDWPRDAVPSGEIPVLELVRDGDTRWSTIYLMIDRMFTLYPAVERLCGAHTNIADLTPFSPAQLRVLRDIHAFLYLFHIVQERASQESTPTVHQVLPLFEQLLDTLDNVCEALPGLAYAVNASKMKLREYLAKSRRSSVYVLAMATNHRFKMSWIREKWSPEEQENAEKVILDVMLSHYQAMHSIPPSRARASRHAHHVPSKAVRKQNAADDLLSSFQQKVAHNASLVRADDHSSPSSPFPAVPTVRSPRPETPEPGKCDERQAAEAAVRAEWERYLEKGTIPQERVADYDPLREWADDRHTYPILFRVAVDILPAQASAVPCERAFSSSKLTDTDQRGRADVTLVEVFQILKSVFHGKELAFTDAWVSRAAEEREKLVVADIDAGELRRLLSTGNLTELQQLLGSGTDDAPIETDLSSSNSDY